MNSPLAIWVGYLNPTTGIRDIVSHFEHCGSIWQVKLMRAAKNSHPFAFVWFEKACSARRALDLDRSILHGSIIKVRMKRPDFIAIPPPPPPIRFSSLTPPPGASVQIMDPYTHQHMTIMEGSNLAQQISSLPPIHVANPEVLLLTY